MAKEVANLTEITQVAASEGEGCFKLQKIKKIRPSLSPRYFCDFLKEILVVTKSTPC